MPNVVSKETCLPLSVDDSKCFRLILGQDDGKKLQDDLDRLYKWSRTWNMDFNATKCKVLGIVRNKSQDLSWNTHVEYVTAKAKKKC